MNAARFLLDLFYPRRGTCVACGTMLGLDRDDLCEKCREELAANWVGVRGLNRKSGLDGAAFAYRYRSPAGAMARSLKYSGVRILAEEMCRDLSRAAAFLQLKDVDAVTSVPMHPKRLRLRDRNHAEVLARGVAEITGAPYRELLVRKRNAPQQARLKHDERVRNLRGCFAAESDLRGLRILLIDDVYTTGSTARFCAEALRAAGAEKVYFAAYVLGEKGRKHGQNHQR